MSQDGEFVENLAQEFTDLRRDILSRISALENEFDTSPAADVQMSEEEDNSPLPAIAIHESIQVCF